MPTKIQDQTKIFNYEMKLKYNRKKMSTSLLFFLLKSYKSYNLKQYLVRLR